MGIPKYFSTCKYFIDDNHEYGYCFFKSRTVYDVIDNNSCINCYKFDDSDTNIPEYLQEQINKRRKWLRETRPLA